MPNQHTHMLAIPTLQPLPDPMLDSRAQRRDALENRQHLMTTARQLFTEHGVANVSMNQIAQTAEVGPGTLYRHFPNKGILCAALSVDSTWQLYEDVQRELGVWPANCTALEQLGRFLERLAIYNEQHTPYQQATSAADWGNRMDTRYQNPLYSWLHETGVVLLRRAVSANELPELDLDWVADALLATLDGGLYQYQRHVRGRSLEQISTAAQQFCQLLRQRPNG